ncbi:MAG TPA: hypothetical protein DCL21_02275 [Alphaproteobacteria bacterium]|nr:hypothetical protein [Alphaproteobacteria bacterium]
MEYCKQYYPSTLTRAINTAKIAKSDLNIPIQHIEEFNELPFGDCEAIGTKRGQKAIS